MRFNCLKNKTFTYNSYKIISIRKEDIYKIREWRNDQMNILRQKKILTNEDQDNYYKSSIVPMFNKKQPEQILFSFIENNLCIGYGGLVHINWLDKKAEVSFLVDTKRTKELSIYTNNFQAFLTLIKIVAFDKLNFNRIYTETYDIRSYHIDILQKSGFILEGRLRENVFIHNKPIDSLIHSMLSNDYYEG